MKKVLLIDSGSGGVNILKECVKVCPHCDFLLFCDSLNLPYGNKDKESLIDITIKNLELIKPIFNFEVVIFACNTLTATVIDEMRAYYPDIIFIGTVPAIKPALQDFEGKDILVLATEATIKNNKLIKKYSNEKLQLLFINELAPLIDENLDNLQILKPFLEEKLKDFYPKAIVLGCTHYLSVANILKEIYPNCKIYDSANGVARRLESFVMHEQNDGYQVQMLCTGQDNLGRFWWLFNQN